MTDHAHTSHAISWVFTAQILSELKLIWHILQTDLVFIQQTIAHKGHPQQTRPLILIGVKRANFFVITPTCIGCSLSQRRDQGNFDLTHQYLRICRGRSMGLPKEIEKEKNVNSTLVFFLPQNPQGNFHRVQNTEEVVRREGSMPCTGLYLLFGTIIHYRPARNLDLPPRWLKVWKSHLVCVAGRISKRPNCLFVQAQLLKVN